MTKSKIRLSQEEFDTLPRKVRTAVLAQQAVGRWYTREYAPFRFMRYTRLYPRNRGGVENESRE